MKPFLFLLLVAASSIDTAAVAAARSAPARAGSPPVAIAVEKLASEQLTIKLSAHVASAPADVLVQMRLEPDSRSRLLSVEWWSQDGVGGSHEVSLEGDRAAVRHSYPIKRMEAGVYVVSAVVVRNDGTRITRTSRLIVVAKGESAALMGLGADDLTAAEPLARDR